MADDRQAQHAAGAERVRLAVVHWPPVDLYPPMMNLTRAMEREGGFDVTLHTTADHMKQPAFSVPGMEVKRRRSAAGRRGPGKLLAYAWFHLATVVRLLRDRPRAILHVEPSSAFPVWVHSWLRPRTPIFVHHHEYHSPEQFLRPGMRLIRWFHRLERRRLLPRAAWISHTNAKRMELYRNDCPEAPEAVCRLLPNLPPASWQGTANEAWRAGAGPFRFVYVGSLSLRDTFIGEFVEWMATLPAGTATCDIHAYNLDAETADFLMAPGTAAAGVRWIRGGIPYDKLPECLRQYHAGLILYRARTLNYRFNETNKLFEYLACGLDVWYPDVMEGIRPHDRADAAPRVLPFDFSRLAASDAKTWMQRPDGLREEAWDRWAEDAVAPLLAALAGREGAC